MEDERAAYPGSSHRSKQLSCTKYFHPSYELFYMIIRGFKTISVIILKTKIELLHQHDVIMTSAGSAVNSNQVDWSKGQQGPIVIVYLIS